MSMHEVVRDAVIAKLEREQGFMNGAPLGFMWHVKVWLDDDGAVLGVTLDFQEAQPRKWRRGREAA